MPTGVPHELLVELFRSAPSLAATLLATLHAELPDFEHAELADATLPIVDVSPLRADLLVRLVDDARVRAVVLLEAQRNPDPAKLYDWPAHVALAQRAHRCPAWLLVVTLDERVARWTRHVTSRDSLGHVQRVVVLGPSAIPRLTDPSLAETAPELAMLSTLAHAGDPDADALAPMVRALLLRLDDTRASIYADEILRTASRSLMKLFDQMALDDYEFKSDYFRNKIANAAAAARAEGISQGISRGRADDVLAVFDARRMIVSPATRERIVACTDLDMLGEWLRRAVTVEHADEIFAVG